MAETKLQIKVYDRNYEVTVTLNHDEGDEMQGSVTAETPYHGYCEGRYQIDPEQSELVITYNGPDGRGTGGGCHNESMTISVDPADVEALYQGQEVAATVVSILYYGAPQNAVIQLVTP
jgi:hypothetical protein